MEKDLTNNMRDTREAFLVFEKKHQLLEYKIEGLEIWQCIRNSLFEHIISIQNGFHVAHASISKIDKLRFVPNIIFNSIFRNPFYIKKGIETIFLENPRKFEESLNGEPINIDPYTHYFIKGFSGEFEVLEDMYLFEHKKSVFSTNKYLDIFYLYNFFIIKSKKSEISEKDKLFLKKINNEINRSLKINLDLLGYIEKHFKSYYSQYKFYKKLFEKIKPKQLYLVCSYGKGGIIKAAKENGVVVKEFQHGFLNSFHLGYHFPYLNKKDSLVTFPDQLLIFGKFWSDITNFPLSEENIILYGYPYLNNQIKKETIDSNRNKILFISQGTIGKELSQFFYSVAKELSDYNFIYKLHPGEVHGWQEKYPDLMKAKTLDNVEVRENGSIYEDFSEAFVQVGVYSTAIFEGIAFECKTILLSIPGIEYMEDLIETEYVDVVSTIEGFKEALKSNNSSALPKEYFFHQSETSVSN